MRVDGPPRRHGRLSLALYGYADPLAELKDSTAWHVSLTESDLRWLQRTIPAALEGIERQRQEYKTWDRT